MCDLISTVLLLHDEDVGYSLTCGLVTSLVNKISFRNTGHCFIFIFLYNWSFFKQDIVPPEDYTLNLCGFVLSKVFLWSPYIQFPAQNVSGKTSIDQSIATCHKYSCVKLILCLAAVDRPHTVSGELTVFTALTALASVAYAHTYTLRARHAQCQHVLSQYLTLWMSMPSLICHF